MALHCVRNTVSEDYHASGKLTDAEMSAFNHEVADKIYSFLLLVLYPRYAKARVNTLMWLYPPQWGSISCSCFF